MNLNGWSYHQQTEIYWLRLTLVIQSLTHLEQGSSFFPITQNRSIQAWVKQLLSREGGTARHEWLEQLYRELMAFLTSCHKQQANLFVLQLSGAERIGLTLEQAARTCGLRPDEARVMQQLRSINC